MAGGRLFPGEQHSAQFDVTDHDSHIDFSMQSGDGLVSIKITGSDSDTLPATSSFKTLPAASAFFEGGSLGYSATQNGDRFDGMLLRTLEWRLRAFSVTQVHSSYFADRRHFPEGSIEFDHALVMRDILHEWHQAEDMRAIPHATSYER